MAVAYQIPEGVDRQDFLEGQLLESMLTLYRVDPDFTAEKAEEMISNTEMTRERREAFMASFRSRMAR